MIGRRARSTKKRRPIIESDDSEEELEYERRALSPSTRRSIGIFVGHSSDEEEIEEEEEPEDENAPAEDENDVTADVKENSMDQNSIAEFENSIQQKVSSTMAPGMMPMNNEVTLIEDSDNENDDSDVQIIKKSNEILEIGSSDEENSPTKPTLQPKIANLLVKKPQSTPKLESSKKKISRSMYEHECRELDAMKRKKDVLLNVLMTRHSLPDNGKKIELTLQDLEKNITKQENKLQGLEVDENQSLKNSLRNDSVEVVEDNQNSNDVTGELYSIVEVREPGPVSVLKPQNGINWNEIENANKLVQPKHFGKQGMKTFENQKALTEKRLNNIHGSLTSQPTEDVLHPTPAALNIELMDHQKHGLAWMLWREKNKPRGGILADDMGLGKTLSMISLIMEKLEDEENEQQDDDDDSDLDESHGWVGKGRRSNYNGGTLVVCPASLLQQWESEISNRVRRNTVSLYIHHGSNREPKAKYLARENIVVTTYSIVSSEYKSEAALFGVKWNRIILDEAHTIRNHKTVASMACSALRGKYRWALTGTPICNKEMDIYALLRFLRVTPFDDLPTYKRWLEDKKGGGGPRIHALMKTMLLRRTKEMLRAKDELKLPDKMVHEVEVTLNQNEKNVYSKVLAYSRTLFTEYLAQRGGGGNADPYAQSSNANKFSQLHDKFAAVHGTVQVHQILTLLLRLRQICDHPGLIKAMLSSSEELDISSGHDETHSSLHEVDLIKQLEQLEINDDADDEAAVRFSNKLMSTANPIFNLDRPSSKISSVMTYFKEHVQDTGDKAIFVSQWTNVLKLFEPRLVAAGVKFVSLTGEVPVKSRGSIIEQFNRTGSNAPQVMLLSLTAGGVGLNLSVANHLFMIDCHWNPQLENQAQDRVYRVGQKKEVHLYKFITKDSIEERIKGLQQKKLDLANTVLTGAKNIGSKLTIQDLRSLFEV
ncbi:transcription termination factor 2 [Culicoides brevitarsis]|uniref:transcription termination factor 2 n=1 Tax=Culicoides brevitarsis TaxID=469753 RepID=UPI00307C7911